MLTLEYPAALGPQAARGPASVVDIIAPAPILDPMPECSVPYAEPRTLRISRLQLPEIVAENGDDQIAGVRVRLAPNGSVVSVTVVEPSHLPAFDEAVVHAAQHSTYAPGIFRCAAVGGEYKFVGAAQPR
jgi:TonB family protein